MSTTGLQLRPLSVGEQLDAAFKVVRSSFGVLATCVLVVALPLNILNTVILASTRDNPFSLHAATNDVSTTTAVVGQLATGLLERGAHDLRGGGLLPRGVGRIPG